MLHWLLAFDAAGMALSRAFALLSTHPDQLRQALADVGSGTLASPESVLHDVTTDTRWPAFAAAVHDRTPIRSTMSIRLYTSDLELGTSNLHFRHHQSVRRPRQPGSGRRPGHPRSHRTEHHPSRRTIPSQR
ncbi:hypothetical protein [Williamsia sterculiae]|uniref:hypothetical protein n=1 Tax=Williamsia sterculiae TaxID=1344003 RepID=UPI0009714CAD|nr:hypothetical protein [Williamsia sterculiae]